MEKKVGVFLFQMKKVAVYIKGQLGVPLCSLGILGDYNP